MCHSCGVVQNPTGATIHGRYYRDELGVLERGPGRWPWLIKFHSKAPRLRRLSTVGYPFAWADWVGGLQVTRS
jgi:hypothetical protein